MLFATYDFTTMYNTNKLVSTKELFNKIELLQISQTYVRAVLTCLPKILNYENIFEVVMKLEKPPWLRFLGTI